jgi:hypothetical protein
VKRKQGHASLLAARAKSWSFLPEWKHLTWTQSLSFLSEKKTKLENFLAKLQKEHASVAVSVAPVMDMLHAAGALSVLHAPPHSAAQASAALNAAAAQ